MELKGKSAVVTGSARGIGREIALMLAKAGADLVISDLNEEAGLEVVEEIKKSRSKGNLGQIGCQ